MNTMIRQFEIVKDEQGYAMAIAVDGWFLIHLQRGTVRNEENAAKLLAVLNAAVASVNNPAWAGVCDEDVALEKTVQDLMPNTPHQARPEPPPKIAGRAGDGASLAEITAERDALSEEVKKLNKEKKWTMKKSELSWRSIRNGWWAKRETSGPT